jgi:hypothetical protein
MLSRDLLLKLIAGLVVLPIALVILLAAGRLLLAMGDTVGARWLDGLALVGGIGWLVDLVVLVLVLGIRALGPTDSESE